MYWCIWSPSGSMLCSELCEISNITLFFLKTLLITRLSNSSFQFLGWMTLHGFSMLTHFLFWQGRPSLAAVIDSNSKQDSFLPTYWYRRAVSVKWKQLGDSRWRFSLFVEQKESIRTFALARLLVNHTGNGSCSLTYKKRRREVHDYYKETPQFSGFQYLILTEKFCQVLVGPVHNPHALPLQIKKFHLVRRSLQWLLIKLD